MTAEVIMELDEEIERLKEVVTRLHGEKLELKADNEQLRAALQLAADHLASEGYTIEAEMARRTGAKAMTDIVERLRLHPGYEPDWHLRMEAATEIWQLRANTDSLWQDVQRADEANKELQADNARLRADRARLFELADSAHDEGFKQGEALGNAVNEELRADNARLRSALQKVADLVDSEADEPLDDAIAIARRALEHKP